MYRQFFVFAHGAHAPTHGPAQVNGAIIMKVLPNTPAADAGLRRHDVVIEMRGRPIRTADEAKQVVDESSVGDVIALKVRRDYRFYLQQECFMASALGGGGAAGGVLSG